MRKNINIALYFTRGKKISPAVLKVTTGLRVGHRRNSNSVTVCNWLREGRCKDGKREGVEATFMGLTPWLVSPFHHRDYIETGCARRRSMKESQRRTMATNRYLVKQTVEGRKAGQA